MTRLPPLFPSRSTTPASNSLILSGSPQDAEEINDQPSDPRCETCNAFCIKCVAMSMKLNSEFERSRKFETELKRARETIDRLQSRMSTISNHITPVPMNLVASRSIPSSHSSSSSTSDQGTQRQQSKRTVANSNLLVVLIESPVHQNTGSALVANYFEADESTLNETQKASLDNVKASIRSFNTSASLKKLRSEVISPEYQGKSSSLLSSDIANLLFNAAKSANVSSQCENLRNFFSGDLFEIIKKETRFCRSFDNVSEAEFIGRVYILFHMVKNRYKGDVVTIKKEKVVLKEDEKRSGSESLREATIEFGGDEGPEGKRGMDRKETNKEEGDAIQQEMSETLKKREVDIPAVPKAPGMICLLLSDLTIFSIQPFHFPLKVSSGIERKQGESIEEQAVVG